MGKVFEGVRHGKYFNYREQKQWELYLCVLSGEKSVSSISSALRLAEMRLRWWVVIGCAMLRSDLSNCCQCHCTVDPDPGHTCDRPTFHSRNSNRKPRRKSQPQLNQHLSRTHFFHIVGQHFGWVNLPPELTNNSGQAFNEMLPTWGWLGIFSCGQLWEWWASELLALKMFHFPDAKFQVLKTLTPWWELFKVWALNRKRQKAEQKAELWK